MSVALQIREVPEDVRDALAERAAARGQSMQAFLLEMVSREARLARNVDLFWRTADLRVDLSDADVVGIIREGRDGGFDIDRDQYDL